MIISLKSLAKRFFEANGMRWNGTSRPAARGRGCGEAVTLVMDAPVRILTLIPGLLLTLPLFAQPAETLFETEVRPLLHARCVGCHNAKTQSGGLALDSKGGFQKGGA